MWTFYSLRFAVTGELPAPTLVVQPTSSLHLAYALDLTLVVPSYTLAGVLLWRRRSWGFVAAAVLLVSGIAHQLTYLSALAFQAIADVSGSTAFDPLEPFILLVFVVATALLLGQPASPPAMTATPAVPRDHGGTITPQEPCGGHPATTGAARIHRMTSVSFLGLRTREFDAMRQLYAEAYGLHVLREAPGAVWFSLADGAELHVYAENDEDHAFFGDGPVPGLLVDDFTATVERLTARGVQWVTEPETASGRVWRHYRAPDGNVYEVMGLAAARSKRPTPAAGTVLQRNSD